MLINSVKEIKEITNAKPFLKWAGGKTQLLNELVNRLPTSIKNNHIIESYIEPFVGGGAMFFFLKNNYKIKKSYLFDINRELILGYKIIQNDPIRLIKKLKKIEKEYLNKTEEKRKEYYYNIRETYNKQMLNFNYKDYNDSWVERAAYLIFFNKTCYNGLFRQNKKGKFNVPSGKYKEPRICFEENIIEVNKALQNTEIFCGDFNTSEKYIEKGSFIYIDPPYLPLNKTSSFTDYSKEGFTEKDQIRLVEFFKNMDKKGAYLMLSNSDPRNENPSNNFFDELYKDYVISRVKASRVINCKGSKRGLIRELIITKYKNGE